MPERRQFGVPEINAGPWASYVRAAGATGQQVVKQDKIASTTQRAIEDCFRPYWVAVEALQAAYEHQEPPTAADLDVLLLLGKCIANAAVYHEQNRVEAALAVLKPGAEDLYGQQAKQPLLGDDAVDALRSMRDTQKLATKLEVAGTAPSRGRGNRQRQNSRAGGRPTAAPGPQQQQAAASARGKGAKGGRARGGARGRN
jgi:hypothetical protein